MPASAPIVVAALYRFTRLPDPAARKAPLEAACRAAGVTGTLILAPEGINGTIAGPREGIDAALDHIRTLPGCDDLEPAESQAAETPFGKLKIRLRPEIVTLGRPDLDPAEAAGRYVEPEDWNALISDPEVAVIDTRNDYEVQIGSFEGAIDPGTGSFRDFPAWWEENGESLRGRKVAMFCTGGIRCEKSTSFLRSQGVEEVFHLRGGILNYLDRVPQAESLWRGACFVFDDRVSLRHGLAEGDHLLCHGCRKPLAPEDLDRPGYERGVSCHRCVDATSEADKARFRERQRQLDLARARAGHGTPAA